MDEYLLKIVDNFSNNVLAIGTSEKITNSINNNKKVLKFDLLEKTEKGIKIKRKNKMKKINIKKIRKIFKKKKTDFIICEYETIKKYLNTFVKDSVYINKNKLYIYGTLEDIEFLVKRYKRYNVKIDLTRKKDYFILSVDNNLSKNNKIKDFFYLIVDNFDKIIEFIGDIIMGVDIWKKDLL